MNKFTDDSITYKSYTTQDLIKFVNFCKTLTVESIEELRKKSGKCDDVAITNLEFENAEVTFDIYHANFSCTLYDKERNEVVENFKFKINLKYEYEGK
jgi:hypothetical protein